MNEIVFIPVSVGEYLDKLSILAIKANKIKDPVKTEQVEYEYNALKFCTEIFDNGYYNELLDVNTKLWDIEDALRQMEDNQDFSERFVELARKVYLLNDKRSMIKRRINEKYSSAINEVKSYQ